jgi:hypothetical protein
MKRSSMRSSNIILRHSYKAKEKISPHLLK